MSTAKLEAAIGWMFPPGRAVRARGWVWRSDGPVEIEYEAGFSETGHPYLHDISNGHELEMTPVDCREDLPGGLKGES